MHYQGSCHCGKIAFTVEGEIGSVVECNCSHCRRKGYLLWFVPQAAFHLTTSPADIETYTLPVTNHMTNGGAAVVLLQQKQAQPVLDVFRGKDPAAWATVTVAPLAAQRQRRDRKGPGRDGGHPPSLPQIRICAT